MTRRGRPAPPVQVAPPAIPEPGMLPRALLRCALAAVTSASVLVTFLSLLRTYPLAVDLEIPMDAAARWIHGAQPYLASSFEFTSGPGQPFLYPPLLLPILAPFAALPREAVTVAWALLSLGAAAWTCGRLGLPRWTWPFVLAWAPYAQPLLGLNVQVMLFAAFVALFFDPPSPDRRVGGTLPEIRALRGRDIASPSRPPLVDGLLGVLVALLKTSQVHPWVYLVRRRPRAAVLGAVAVLSLVCATLPFTGIGAWFDWFDQVRRAAQPGLNVGGISLLHLLPFPLAAALGACTVLLVFAVPSRHAGAWIGLLTLAGSPDLHFFGLLFALPAMLTVRREIALVAALAISSYTTDGAWVGVALVAAALLLSTRQPALLEPHARQSAAHPAGRNLRRSANAARASRDRS